MNFNPLTYRIFECITGSKLYGISTPESDTDLRGVCLPPMPIILDPFTSFEQKDSGFEEDDRVIYSLGKFVKLCADSNPNIIELLFIPKNFKLFSTPAWEELIDFKHLFLSKKVKYTFTGYAVAQLNAIKRHRKWFIDPPVKKPERQDFGLTSTPIATQQEIATLMQVKPELLAENFREELILEIQYRAEKTAWDNYLAWKNNRNPARQALEEKFGYDTKHASHLFRLMSEGKELLLFGRITFPLPNAEEILSIRNGLYSYDEVIEKATNLEKEFDVWYTKSGLLDAPDIYKLSTLYYNIVRKYGSDIITW